MEGNIRQLYKLDLSKLASEGRVFIIKNEEGIYTKDEARKLAKQILRDNDRSIIKQMPWPVFRNLIKYMDYISIIKLCNSSELYQDFCEDNRVWGYLLERDFNPLLQEDDDRLDNGEITAKQLYYRIQEQDIMELKKIYRKWKRIFLGERDGYNEYQFDQYGIQERLLKNKQQKELMYYELLWLMNEKFYDPSVDDNFLINRAAMHGYADIVKLLLRDERVRRVGENIHNELLLVACDHNKKDVVKVLLEDPQVDPAYKNNKAIIRAILSPIERHDYGTIILLLTDERVDPSDRNNEAIIIASRRGDIEVIRLLLQDPRVDPTAQDNNAIKLAKRYRRNEIVQLLIEYGADPNA